MIKPKESTRELLKPFAQMTIGEFIPIIKAATGMHDLKMIPNTLVRLTARYAAISIKNN